MRLHHITFTHYSQKDSETGTLSWVVAEDEEQVVQFLAGGAMPSFSNWERDGDEDEVSPVNSWWDENPGEADRARALGLTVHLCDWGERDGQPDWVSGPRADVARWWRGDPTEVSDLYYGATRVGWDAGVEVSESDVEVLVRLGIALDLRSSP